MTTRRSSSPSAGPRISDVLLGVTLLVAGAFLLVGPFLGVAPSLAGLAGLALVCGALGLLGALLSRSSPGFAAESLSAASAIVLGVVIVRFPDTALATLLLLAGALIGVNAIVRLASISEYPQLRGVFLFAGAASLAIAAAALTGAVPGTQAALTLIVGVELAVDGASALAIGRLDRR